MALEISTWYQSMDSVAVSRAPLNGELRTTPKVRVSASSFSRLALPVMLASSIGKLKGKGPTTASGKLGAVCQGLSLLPPVERLISSLHSSMTWARLGLSGWLPQVVLLVFAIQGSAPAKPRTLVVAPVNSSATLG